MKTIILFLMSAVICLPAAEAQTALTVGEKMPGFVLNNILNSKSTSAKLVAEKNQLLLIDFWGTTCGSCIGSMPKMLALQKKFADSIKVFFVSPEPKERIDDLFRRRKDVKAIGLPIAYGDIKLRKTFPYQSVPQIVIIDDQQRIRAITSHENITEQNLRRILSDDTATLPLKRDIIDFDYTAPFLKSDEIAPDEIIFSTLFIAQKPGLLYSSAFKNKSTKIVAVNNSVRDLYEFAYKKQVIIPLYEKEMRIMIDSGINSSVRFCFELNTPPESDKKKTEEKALLQMQSSLDLFFNVRSHIENKWMECWVIKSPGNSDTTVLQERLYNETFSTLELVNNNAMALPSFIHTIVSVNMPVLYEGNKLQKITIKFNKKGETLEHIIELLNEKGFQMVREKRELKIIHLRKE